MIMIDMEPAAPIMRLETDGTRLPLLTEEPFILSQTEAVIIFQLGVPL